MKSELNNCAGSIGAKQQWKWKIKIKKKEAKPIWNNKIAIITSHVHIFRGIKERKEKKKKKRKKKEKKLQNCIWTNGIRLSNPKLNSFVSFIQPPVMLSFFFYRDSIVTTTATEKKRKI